MSTTGTSWPTTALADYYYPKVYADLLEEVAEHEMLVLHDDDVYRHLRFKKPGTMMWHFDIITYPGHLVTTGDIADGYVFSREHDMVPWFLSDAREPGHINVSYWAEKTARTITTRGYDEETARESIRNEIREYARDNALEADDARALFLEVEEEVISGLWQGMDWLGTALNDFEQGEFQFRDWYELGFQEYDYHFLLTCHAILWGLQKYRAVQS